jgi:hypothetical protein
MRIVLGSGIARCHIFALNKVLSLGKEVNSVAGTGGAGGVMEFRATAACVEGNGSAVRLGVVGSFADQIDREVSALVESSKSISVGRVVGGWGVDGGKHGMVTVTVESESESAAEPLDAGKESLELGRATTSGADLGNISKSIFDSRAARFCVWSVEVCELVIL